MRIRAFVVLSLVMLLSRSAVAIDHRVALRADQSRAAGETDDIQKLIAQLGSDDFTKRRDAEAKLIELGGAAFDALQDAQTDPDLEIATQSQYLLHRVPIDWARDTDVEEVRELMANYAKVNGRERREIVTQLKDLKAGAGLGALSRIAHYELSPALAKHAAHAVLSGRSEHEKNATAQAKLINTEIGDSPRDSAAWLRLYAAQLSDSESVNPGWLKLIDGEIAQMKEDQDRTNLSTLLKLMEFHVQLCKDHGQAEALFESLRRRVDLLIAEFGQAREAIAPDIQWCIKNKQWAALDLLEKHYEKLIKDDRLLVYLVAAARSARGDSTAAQEFAERAYKHVAVGHKDSDLEERSHIGDLIADLGYHDWAEREWQFVIENAPLTSTESMIARSSVANWCLHDRGEDKEAAELLGEVCDAVDNDEELKAALQTNSEASYYLNKVLRTQRDYFTACHLANEKDYKGQRKSLERAYSRNHKDPDVLIAMYRLQESDDTYRERVKGRIVRALAEVEQEIEGNPAEPNGYNHYAWLVSNTEGDYDKAVRYSLKSLELRPETPSYLDTLGRCHFAAGDVDKAVEAQRKAVEMHPNVKVMQKQLEVFEKAQAEKKKKS